MRYWKRFSNIFSALGNCSCSSFCQPIVPSFVFFVSRFVRRAPEIFNLAAPFSVSPNEAKFCTMNLMMPDLFATPAFSRFLQFAQPLYDFLLFGISSLGALCISTLFSINPSAFFSSSEQDFLFLFSSVGEYLLNPNEATNLYCNLQQIKESDTILPINPLPSSSSREYFHFLCRLVVLSSHKIFVAFKNDVSSNLSRNIIKQKKLKVADQLSFFISFMLSSHKQHPLPLLAALPSLLSLLLLDLLLLPPHPPSRNPICFLFCHLSLSPSFLRQSTKLRCPHGKNIFTDLFHSMSQSFCMLISQSHSVLILSPFSFLLPNSDASLVPVVCFLSFPSPIILSSSHTRH